MAEEVNQVEDIPEVVSRWKMFSDAIVNAKKTLASGLFIIAAMVGGWELITANFVTKAYAEEMVGTAVGGISKEVHELKKQSKAQSSMLVEMRMIRMEGKIQNGGTLTPTEQRVYDKLKRLYEAVE